jgi:tungstate transport system substrate-binding protein
MGLKSHGQEFLQGVEKMRKRFASTLAVFIILSMAALLFVGCGAAGPEAPEPTPTVQPDPPPPAPDPDPDPPPPDPDPTPIPHQGTIVLATTTSTDDSGLLDFILPVFTAETGWDVQVISVGTGAALQMGRDGEADVLLVHARAQEDQFVEDGYAQARFDVMYNDFVVVGPDGGEISHNSDIELTFTDILEQNLRFISRGDESGTHSRELQIWTALGFDPEDNDNYLESGQGMGATLGMAAEMDAFTLADRATWLAYPDTGNLVIVCEGNPRLLNPYGVMVVATTLEPVGAQAFVDWIRSPSAQALIGLFGIDDFGQSLFFPDA